MIMGSELLSNSKQGCEIVSVQPIMVMPSLFYPFRADLQLEASKIGEILWAELSTPSSSLSSHGLEYHGIEKECT